MTKVKTCPHCGGDAILRATQDATGEWLICVECMLCGATGKGYLQDDDPDVIGWDTNACRKAVNAWNKRYTPPVEDSPLYLGDLQHRRLM